MVAYRHLYLSPHLDDAVLSCGGTIHAQVAAGEPVAVTTLFAASPSPGPLSPFAAELHERWGLGNDPAAGRRLEDQRALALLGAASVHLPFADCIYRTGPDGAPLYPSRDAIFGPLHPAEAGLADDLARALAALAIPPDAHVYVPLGIGGHVDHRLTRLAAERWLPARSGFAYYEEYPYTEAVALTPLSPSPAVAGEGESVLIALPPLSHSVGEGPGVRAMWRIAVVPLTEDDLTAKIGAIACYASQLSSFYAGVEDMAQRVRAHAARVAEGRGYAERFPYPIIS